MMIVNIKKQRNKKVYNSCLFIKDCLFNDTTIPKSQQRFKSDCHKVYTEQLNKIALKSNDDKRLQTFDKITTFPYVRNAFRVCGSEMLSII